MRFPHGRIAPRINIKRIAKLITQGVGNPDAHREARITKTVEQHRRGMGGDGFQPISGRGRNGGVTLVTEVEQFHRRRRQRIGRRGTKELIHLGQGFPGEGLMQQRRLRTRNGIGEPGQEIRGRLKAGGTLHLRFRRRKHDQRGHGGDAVAGREIGMRVDIKRDAFDGGQGLHDLRIGKSETGH